MGAGFLLARSAGLGFQPRFLALAAAMTVLFALAIGIEKQLAVSSNDFLVMAGAYFAAALAALVYAGIVADQSNRKQVFAPYMLRLSGCLNWAGAGALFVAYVFDSWMAAGIVGMAVFCFLARYPWLAMHRAAIWAQDLGEHARAERLLRRAVALAPDPIMQAQFWARLAQLYLLQERGGAALEAQEAKEALLVAQAAANPSLPNGANSPAYQPTFYQPTLNDLEQRASALMLLDRYDDALTRCEQMLQQPSGESAGPLRLLVVHMYLTRLAMLRGWGDEAFAQADWCLRASAQLPLNLQARIRVRRATALVMQGQADAALQECRRAMQGAGETRTQAAAANAEAQAHLLAGRTEQAEKDAQRALRLMPQNLQFRYWHGRVLLAQGRGEEGRRLLKDLAAEFPQEHWGREAQSALTSAQSALTSAQSALTSAQSALTSAQSALTSAQSALTSA